MTVFNAGPRKRIPIKEAERIAARLGLQQVILCAWDGTRTHIVTYGRSREDCAQAALGGNRIKEALGWPKDLQAEPSRVRGLIDAVKDGETLIAALELVLAAYRKKRSVDGLNGRGWDSGRHLEAEADIDRSEGMLAQARAIVTDRKQARHVR